MNERLDKYNYQLKQAFGYDSLKKEQFQIIDKVIHEKIDVCAILATGFGKSICYQLPYLITKKCVIVVSPLLSLMKDQKMEMIKLKIPVCCFNSDLKPSQKMNQINTIMAGDNKLIYMTPEYLLTAEYFIKAMQSDIALVCIDEAHCVSSWGNDFRESYSKLNVIKKWVPNIPVLALTATASQKVREDICNKLSLNNPTMIIGSFDRPNLYIEVRKKGKNAKEDLNDILQKYPNEYTIIYCQTRDDTEKIALQLSDINIDSLAYHAGISSTDRNEIQEKFNSGQYKCIVATIAFGMGINVPNVRLVIHYGCPKNLESYYQEIGRAGRDQKPSECYLFYSKRDFTVNRFFLKDIKNDKYRAFQEQELRNIEKYVNTNECRRKILLKSFGESKDNCNNCDNCKKDVKTNKIDYTFPCYQLLSISSQLNGKFGAGTYINILRGSEAKNMAQHKDLILYGCGKQYSQDHYKELTRILINNDYLREVVIAKRFGTTIECTQKATQWLNNIESIYGSTIDEKTVFLDEDKLLFEGPEQHNQPAHISVPTTLSNTRWTAQQEQELLLKMLSGCSIKEISETLSRTSGGIRARLKLIVLRLYTQGKTLNEISAVTGLGHAKINAMLPS